METQNKPCRAVAVAWCFPNPGRGEEGPRVEILTEQAVAELGLAWPETQEEEIAVAEAWLATQDFLSWCAPGTWKVERAWDDCGGVFVWVETGEEFCHFTTRSL